MSAVEIRPVSGIAVEPWLDELADLRIRIFRDYPYLYDGSVEYNRLIGAATGLPLSDADPEFVAPFERHGPPPEQVFYFGESVLLPEYRGEGVGHRFFDLRELYAQDFGYSLTAFCAVVRDPAHPRRPSDYRSLEPFWRGRGYRPEPALTARFPWKDLGDSEETEKTMQFWMRDATLAESEM